MDSKLKELKDVISENCISIILNTHRTSPDNKRDPIVLKNLIKEAEERLFADETKRDAKKLMEKIWELESTIDHNHNLESLILFVNEDRAEYVRLPIAVEDRVIIDYTFATRDIIRSIHLETNYYVLVLSQQETRLIEASSDKVVGEVGTPFPFENKEFYTTNDVHQSNASYQRSLLAEYFNRIDKEVNMVRKNNPLPVLICTEIGNYFEYVKVADQKHSIYEKYLNKNRLHETAQAIVTEAWEIVKEHTNETNNLRLSELKTAVAANLFLSEINDIWKGILRGEVKTLFIEKGLFQSAVIENDTITFVSPEDGRRKEAVDDIFDEMIEMNMNFGGEVVFLPDGELKQYDGFAAITRY